MRITIVSPNLSGCPSILDMGLTYLATYVNERTSHEAKILDFTYRRRGWKKHLKNHLYRFKPDVIGFGTPSLYVNYIKEMIREIHRVYKKDIPIILGGYHPSLKPEECLKIDGVHAICIGDGEYAIHEYLDALKKGKSLKGIKGIYYNDKNRNIIKNEKRVRMEDIDSLPIPNYDLWEDLGIYFFFLNQLYFVGIRGCPFNCTNCSEFPMNKAVPGKRIRMRNPRSYAREIKHQWDKYKGKFDLALTYDAVFNFDKEWTKEFCDEYIKLGLHKELPFSIFSRGDTINKETLEPLAKANCKLVRVGVEVGNEDIRMNVLNKRITNEHMTKSIKLLHKYNMTITAFNMLGCPGESRKTLQETADYMKYLKVDRPIFFIFRPLPETEIIGMLDGLGSRYDKKLMEDIDSLHFGATVKLKDMTQKDVERFQKKCYYYFYSRRVLKFIKKEGIMFFIDWVRYFTKGLKHGVPLHYMMGYFLHNYGKHSIT